MNEVLVAYVDQHSGGIICRRATWDRVQYLPRNMKFAVVRVFHAQGGGTNEVTFQGDSLLALSGTAPGLHLLRFNPPTAHVDWSFDSNGSQEGQRDVDTKLADVMAANAGVQLTTYPTNKPDWQAKVDEGKAVDPLSCPYV